MSSAAKMVKKREEILRLAASRAVFLLRKSQNPQAEMIAAEKALFEASLFQGNPKRDDPSAWADQVIAENPDLFEQSSLWMLERQHRPRDAETMNELIMSLIPSEGRPVENSKAGQTLC